MSVFPVLMCEGCKTHSFSISKVRSTKGLKEKDGGWGDLLFCQVWVSLSSLSLPALRSAHLGIVVAYTRYWNWPTKLMLSPHEMPAQLPKEVRMENGTWLAMRLFEMPSDILNLLYFPRGKTVLFPALEWHWDQADH